MANVKVVQATATPVTVAASASVAVTSAFQQALQEPLVLKAQRVLQVHKAHKARPDPQAPQVLTVSPPTR